MVLRSGGRCLIWKFRDAAPDRRAGHGAPEIGTAMVSHWFYFIGGVVMVLSSLGGAAQSGLSRAGDHRFVGQTWWLVGMAFSSTLAFGFDQFHRDYHPAVTEGPFVQPFAVFKAGAAPALLLLAFLLPMASLWEA